MKKAKIKHEVLNAKQHQREADIIAQAGRPGQITIATNMAGRGTDIVLGGSWQAEIEAIEKPTDAKIKKIKDAWQKRHDDVLEAGGLIIIGSERHESRRIDNQLRGRAGRQGDPGASRFFLSLDDQLVKIFASERMIALMRRLNIGEGEAIESRMVSNAIAKAQKKVEQHYFDMRKQLLEYDNVANDQRTVVYKQRNKLLGTEDVSSVLNGFYEDVVTDLMNKYVPVNSLFEQWDLAGLTESLVRDFDCDLDLDKLIKDEPNLDEKQLYEAILAKLQDEHEQKRAMAEESTFSQYEKVVILHSLDSTWREHLSQMDYLRSSIGLRGYAQKDPKQEYKKESFRLFEQMLSSFRYDVISTLAKLKKEQIAPQEVEDQWRGQMSEINYEHQSDLKMGEDGLSSENKAGGEVLASSDEPKPFMRQSVKVGRNDPCPCGSGKKYKQCHGKVT